MTDMTNPAIVLEALKAKGANDYDAKLIGKSITAIGTMGAKMDAMIHATACAILDRSEMEGVYDASLADKLVNAMPKSGRRKALIAWFGAFSNMVLRLDDKGACKLAGLHKPGSKMHKVVDHAAAFAKPFWSVEEKSVDPKAFDDDAFARAVHALITKGWDKNAKLSAANVEALTKLDAIAKSVPLPAKAKAPVAA